MRHFRKMRSVVGQVGRGLGSSRPLSTPPVPSPPELTSIRYKDQVKRGPFATLSSQHVSFFEGLLGRGRVLTDPNDLTPHNTDWIRMVRGGSQLLLKPRTTEEVSAILQFCNEQRLAVCPQGGNTGLVGGSCPVFDEVILSTVLMNQIISLDEWADVLVCQAGCVLDRLNDYLAQRDLMMPLDLGAKGSCHIGGNVSTNAGGLRLLRYGSLHSTVLGLEAVLADGTVLDCMSGMKKDNTGYDLKHLFIGSEGTLGFVTKVGIHCAPKPKAVNLAFLGLPSFENVLETARVAKGKLGEVLSALEYMDAATMGVVERNLGLRSRIGPWPFYILVECSGSNDEHDKDKLSRFLEHVMEAGLVTDGTVGADSKQISEMWGVRERVAEALMLQGYVYKYDLSIPLPRFDQLVQEMQTRLGSRVTLCSGYGHLGDGNIHLNITCPDYDADLTAHIEPFVFDWVARHKGSISAEHGVGFKLRNYLGYSKSAHNVEIMKQLKQLFDPNRILNPYKVLPD